jgi:uncharacterized protein YndB with AHSA1/START domain
MPKQLRMAMTLAEPPDEVFDLMADPENELSWNPDVIEVRRLDRGPLGRGAHWHARYRGMGAMRIRLEEHERPGRLVFATTGDRIDMRFAFSFSATGAGTNVSADAQVSPKGATRILSPLLGPMMRRTFARRPAQLAAGLAARREPIHQR